MGFMHETFMSFEIVSSIKSSRTSFAGEYLSMMYRYHVSLQCLFLFKRKVTQLLGEHVDSSHLDQITNVILLYRLQLIHQEISDCVSIHFLQWFYLINFIITRQPNLYYQFILPGFSGDWVSLRLRLITNLFNTIQFFML